MFRGAPAACALLALFLASCGRPPARAAIGESFTHPSAEFELIVPEGWHARETRAGVTLVHEVQYGGGFPTLNVRRVDSQETAALALAGSSFTSGGREIQYRYQSWNNSRGRGWRLEALISTGGATLFADASIWDDTPTLNKQLFEAWFWPVLNSVQDRAGP
jgi:hypothetical protein